MIGIVALIVVAGAWFILSTGQDSGQVVSDKAPAEVVLDFYDPWVAARRSTSTDPYQSGLAQAPILSKELSARLVSTEGQPDSEPDPVLCRATIPTQLSARPVFEGEDEAQVLVTSREQGATEQALVTLKHLRGGWYINDIECSLGEFAPEQGEFSFEKEGFLLKSVEPPLDPKYWHLVFEENGEQGHVAPLFFGPASMCQKLDGSTAVCDPSTFTETSKALIQGSMTERGVDVERVELLK